MSGETYHEPLELLSEETKNMHRAIVSLREELDAIDWYQQRAEACSDDELRAVLVHNKNEEIEHAMMVLEWIRRRSPMFGSNIAKYLNTSGPITEIESAQAGESDKNSGAGRASSASDASAPSLGIGSLNLRK